MRKFKIILLCEDSKCLAPKVFDVDENKEIQGIIHIGIVENNITIVKYKIDSNGEYIRENNEIVRETINGNLLGYIYQVKGYEELE